MSILETVKKSLSLKIALKLAVLLVILMAAAGVVIIAEQSRQMEQATMEKARAAVTLGAREYGDMLDEAIDSGLLTVNEVFDTNYVVIKGWDWAGVPKYHTRYDTFTDRAVLVFQDRILEQNPEFLYARGMDVNGYVPTNNTISQRPLDGSERDKLENRTKRIFNKTAAEVNRAKNTEPFLLQVYHRDTGETMWDASAPIFVKGKHWGGFGVGVSMRRLEARQRALTLTLSLIFTASALLTLFAVYVLVRRAMRPVIGLTAAADQISLGEGLDTPLKTDALDEIGILTKSIDRLRASMKAAMSRLGQ
ncbi:MAG TPA: HAMP domain-containing protein [Anaeromyxobacteraceae bacterium]|nr:HAMP domain-containing protein [Anaeromyxobacteraceae bacterium]